MGRGQVSVEYLVIVGLALGLLIPAVLFFYSFNEGSQISSVAANVNDIGLELTGAIKSTYALGRYARQTVEFNMPDEVVGVYVTNIDSAQMLGYEIVFEYETPSGMSQAVFFSDIGIMTNYSMHYTARTDRWNVSSAHPGSTRYVFQSGGSNVTIWEETS